MWTRFCPGDNAITALFRMKLSTPVLSVATTLRLKYSVTVDGFNAPSLKVRTLLYLDRENRWFQVACEMTGGVVEVPVVTVMATVVWWVTLLLFPSTATV